MSDTHRGPACMCASQLLAQASEAVLLTAPTSRSGSAKRVVDS